MSLSDLMQKAVYLGVGIASLAGEKASEKLSELKVQSQKLADEMVARGEMSTEEARRFVDDLIQKAQQPQITVETSDRPHATEPRHIEILTDDEPATPPAAGTPPANSVDDMRQKVMDLQAELRRLQNDGK
jgi:polyhydroxyalkanoate synthesis regulator phasin